MQFLKSYWFLILWVLSFVFMGALLHEFLVKPTWTAKLGWYNPTPEPAECVPDTTVPDTLWSAWILTGGYFRLIFQNDTSDVCKVRWTIISENPEE